MGVAEHTILFETNRPVKELLSSHVRYSQEIFDQAVWQIVSGIEPGRVKSYGEVARIAGFPRHARMVGRALGRCSYPLPWHRVVRSDRTLAFAAGSESYDRQKGLLEKEGVPVINGKVVPPESDENEDLDKLLWGPPGI